MRNWLAVCLGTALISTLSITTANAQPEVHELNTPFVVTMVNPCNAEPVTITGTLSTTVQITSSDSGNFHNSIHNVSKGDGVGAWTDAKYTYSEEFYSGVTTSATTTMTQILTQRLTSASSTDNFSFSMRFHLTVTPGGMPTAMIDRFEPTGCRG